MVCKPPWLWRVYSPKIPENFQGGKKTWHKAQINYWELVRLGLAFPATNGIYPAGIGFSCWFKGRPHEISWWMWGERNRCKCLVFPVNRLRRAVQPARLGGRTSTKTYKNQGKWQRPSHRDQEGRRFADLKKRCDDMEKSKEATEEQRSLERVNSPKYSHLQLCELIIVQPEAVTFVAQNDCFAMFCREKFG